MKHLPFLLLAFLTACIKGPSTFPAEDYACTFPRLSTHPDSARFQSFLEAKTAGGFPGISMLIETQEGEWQGAAGQADIYNDVDMRPCHQHLIGSITKVFTAVLVHQLLVSGELALTDSISRYLDEEIIRKVDNAADATVGDLLRHTSGIPDILDLPFSFAASERPRRFFTAGDLLKQIYPLGAVFPAGTRTAYSNSNYVLLELILERVTGERGETLLQDRIFTPLGLADTWFDQDGGIPVGISRAYFDRYGTGRVTDVTETNAIRASMAGGIVSTPRDLAVFLKALIDDGDVLGTGGPEALLFQPNVPFFRPDDFIYNDGDRVERNLGFGSGLLTLETSDGRAIGFNGGYQGRKARMWYWPESERLIIYFINGSGGEIDAGSRRLFRREMVELLFD